MLQRHLATMILISLVSAAGVVLISDQLVQAKNKQQVVVKAQEFALVNREGVTRASLTLSSQGYLLLALHNEKGKIKEVLVVTPDLVKSSKKTADTLKKLEKLLPTLN